MPELEPRTPRKFKRYFEPFVGGGALFFSLQPTVATLSDMNGDLIETWKAVRDSLPRLLEDLKKHPYESDYFYQLRDADRQKGYARWSTVRKASRLIYLNKTCFNGLYRVNSKGQFNTPFGRYVNPTIVDEENLRACSRVLQGVLIEHRSFGDILSEAESGDFVYFDPPYAPISSTSDFTSYTSEGFSVSDQETLADLCRRLDKKGVFFMLSNSSASFIKKLYEGFRIETVQAPRAINSNASRRGKIAEFIIRNY
ncbi:MAG: DNA adenine methylase [Bdellovibrionales bacterium]|nr:DNA adenine methylase [Bdellovibrionales bacterium]